jgi:hypothetical protein
MKITYLIVMTRMSDQKTSDSTPSTLVGVGATAWMP